MGRRIAKLVDGATTYYLYDKQFRVIEERTAETTWAARYTYGAGIDEPLLMERGGSSYTYHRDALGSVTEISDSNGNLVERYEYDVYGQPEFYDGSYSAITTSAIDNPYLFTGRRCDTESSNYYYRARIYSPTLGRFLSMDPLGYGAGDANLYRYTSNNSVNATDPSGNCPWCLVTAGAFYVGNVIQQTSQNMQNGMSFFEAVYYKNHDQSKILKSIKNGFLLPLEAIPRLDGAADGFLEQFIDNLANPYVGFENGLAQATTKGTAIDLAFFGFGTTLKKGGNLVSGITDNIIKDVSPGQITEFWQKRVTQSDRAGSWASTWDWFNNVIGYEIDGTLVGTLAFSRRQSDKLSQPALYVMALEVLEGNRRSGVGRTLMQEAQSESIQQGMGGNLWAMVNKSKQPNWKDNVAAMQRLGFKIVDDGESITMFFSP